MEQLTDERKAELLALKNRIANKEAARKIREAAANNKAYRASFSREAHDKFVHSRPYLTLLGKGMDED